MKNILFMLVVLSVQPILASGQADQVGDQIEKSVETLEMDQDYQALAEDLEELARKPVRINMAKEEDIGSIPFLTPNQRKALLDYLTNYGEVLSVYELQSIPGFDSLLIRKIEPFITISPPSQVPAVSPRNLARFGHHDILLRYEQGFPEAAGFHPADSLKACNPDAYYKGSPQRYYFRYVYSWFDKIRIGIAGEKDPGEQFFKGAQPNGMDFYTGYLYLSNIGILKNLTIGNFRASYGQGLTFVSGFSLGSVPGFSMNMAPAIGIRPSLGVSEGSYLRGLAATIKIKPFEFSGFVSYHPRDATASISDTISERAEEISSFSTTGYHRTGPELSKRNALTELVCGGNISISKAPSQQLGFRIGITGIYVKYSADVMPRQYPYNQYNFRGNKNLNFGLDYLLRYRRLYLFGEVSRSMNAGMAWIAGASVAPDQAVSVTALYRDYQPAYQNLFSNAFGQNSLNAGERGIYTAINAAVHPKLSIAGYIDLFTFPWLKYRVDFPTSGQEAGAMLTWQAGGNTVLGLRFYQKNTRINAGSEPDMILHKLVSHLSRSYRCTIEWTPAEQIFLKTRIEVKEVREPAAKETYGYFLCQDVKVKPGKWFENITFRFALFDIPVYEARIYTYEPDVLYGYSVPAYQGRGLRTCCVTKFRISRKLDSWLRGGLTYYTDRDEVGTGLDATESNIRAELTVQLLFRL
jgi:hypothetical protein